MKKFKITVEDAKAYLRDAATGPNGQYWGFTPAVMALLNNHDELLVKLGEMKGALEEKDQQLDAEVREWTQKYVNEKARADAAEQHNQLPPLDDDLIDILGRPNFACIRIALALRQLGHDIKRRSENEQAAVIHFLLIHYLTDREQWRITAEAALRGESESKGGDWWPTSVNQ